VAPALLWVLSLDQEALVGTAHQVLAPGPQRGFWSRLVRGSATLAGATLVYPLPFLLLFLLAFGPALWRARRGGAAPARAPEPPAVSARFLGRLIALSLALHWLLVPAAGATEFSEHWLHPALMILPIWLFALLEQCQPTPAALRAYLALLGLVVVVALGARILHYVQGADHCRQCRDLVPFGMLADQLRAAGFGGGTIVADDTYIGGNLRVAFPTSRVINPDWPAAGWPAVRAHGQCLLVWQAQVPGARSQQRRLERWLADGLQVAPAAPHRSGRVAAPMIGSERVFAIGYQLLPDGPGVCR
jgi:hypothetical protein